MKYTLMAVISTPSAAALPEMNQSRILLGCWAPNAMEAAIDDEVQVEFQEVGEITLPRFRLVRS